MLADNFLESTRGRVVAVIRRGHATVDEIAADLDLTGNAVRAQLATLQRDGLIRPAGIRRGVTRPAQTYELTPQLEQLLSRAYMPLLTELVTLLAATQPAAQFNALMRETGRRLARDLAVEAPSGPLSDRVRRAAELMCTELGASARAEKENGGFVIRGTGCPLAALTGKHRGVCQSVESLLAEVTGATVRECCERSERPRCCFHVSPKAPRKSRSAPAA